MSGVLLALRDCFFLPGSRGPVFACLFAAALAGALTAFYLPWLMRQAEFCQSDITYYFEPFCSFFRNELQEGRLALWNPHMYCGMAQAAVPSPGIFYPFTWLLVLMPFSQGLALYLVLHQLFAGVGAFALARRLGWSCAGSAVAGSAAALSGYMFSFPANFTLPATIAWLPFCLLSLVSIRDDSSNRARCLWVPAGAAFHALLVAAGRPELSVPALLLSCLVCFAPKGDHTFNSAQTVALRLGVLGAGVLLSSMTWLPPLEWMTLSPRARGMSSSVVLLWSANWYDWFSMVFGHPFGDLQVLDNKYRDLVTSRRGYLPFLNSTFLGPVPVALAIWGIAGRSWSGRAAVLVLFVASALMAMGANGPLLPHLLLLSPQMGTFRYPVKLIVLPILLAGLAAGRGATQALERQVGGRMLAATAGLSVLGCLAGCAVWLGVRHDASGAPWFSGFLPTTDRLLASQALSLLGKNAAAGFGLVLLFCILTWARSRERLQGPVYSTVMLAAVCIPLIWSAATCNRKGCAPGFFQRPSVAAQAVDYLLGLSPAICNDGQSEPGSSKEKVPGSLEGWTVSAEAAAGLSRSPGSMVVSGGDSGRILCLCFDPLQFPPSLKEQLGKSRDEAYYQYARQVLLVNSQQDFALSSSIGYEAAETRQFRALFRAVYYPCSQNLRAQKGVLRTDRPLACFCRITATNLVFGHAFRQRTPGRVEPLPSLDRRWFDLAAENLQYNLRVYRVKTPARRVFVAASLHPVEAWGAMTREVLKVDGQLPVAPDGIFITAQELRALSADVKTAYASGSSATGSARVVSDTKVEVEIESICKAPCLLVLADTNYPGWEATVDGERVRIVPVNQFMRGVPVSAGTHRVVFKYAPVSLALGLWLAIATAACLFLYSLDLPGLVNRVGRRRND